MNKIKTFVQNPRTREAAKNLAVTAGILAVTALVFDDYLQRVELKTVSWAVHELGMTDQVAEKIMQTIEEEMS